MTRIYAILAMGVIAISLAVGLGFQFIWRPLESCAPIDSVGGSVGGHFELMAGDGQTVTDRDIIKQPSLVYFGYTYCPDVCPYDVARNAAVVDILAEEGIDVVPVFVTIDPSRDTVDVVAEYAEAYHPKMIGLTGTEAQIKAAADAYRVYFRRQDGDDSNYLVDHSTFTYLMLPGNRFADYFRRDDTAEDMAERAACLVAAS